MRKSEKVRHQLKSRWYYIFWGAATASVFAGQMYVGSGYRQMAKSMNRWFEETIDIITMPKRQPRGYYAPLVPPPLSFNEQDMVVR